MKSFSKPVLIIGDIFLDSFISGEVVRISPEAPVPIVKETSRLQTLGGAGNVLNNLISMEIPVTFITSFNEQDEAGKYIMSLLTNVPLSNIKKASTIIKQRFIGNDQQQIMRHDIESTTDIQESEQNIMQSIDSYMTNISMIIISDYNKGLITPSIAQYIIRRATQQNIPTFVDTKKHNVECFRGATVIKPNRTELNILVPGIESLPKKAQHLCELYDFNFCLATCGGDGLLLCTKTTEVCCGGIKRNVFDVSGAGDTVLAAFCAFFFNGHTEEESSYFANIAASIAVSKRGTSVVTLDEILKENINTNRQEAILLTTEEAVKRVTLWKQRGLVVGFTNGCFDLLHLGHITSLNEAKKHCDKLIVGINSDASVQKLKGPTRPIHNDITRAEMAAALRSVDGVVIFSEDTPSCLINELRPTMLFKGQDYEDKSVVGSDMAEVVVLLPMVPGTSTSQIIDKIKALPKTS